MTQRTGIIPGETQDEPGPESPHSARSLHVSQTPPTDRTSELRRVKWPPASKKSEWQRFDDDIELFLDGASRGDTDRRLQTACSIVVTIGIERFGTVEVSQKKTYTMNRRATAIRSLRKELKDLTRQYKRAREEEKAALSQLRSIIRKKLTGLRRAEWHRRRARERTRKRAAFISNPFGFTKKLLGQKRNGQLKCSKGEIDSHLASTYGDDRRDDNLGPCPTLISVPDPTTSFNEKEPTLKEVQEAVSCARSSSAPGPSGVPYKVYKHCPKLLHRLWKTLRVCWRRGRVAEQWRYAEGVWIPKEDKSSTLSQFRTISLLSVEGKIFFSILARRLTAYLLKNSYIDTSVQKGGIPNMPGCLEHTGVVTQLIREAKENKGNLVVVWLDLANAYGSVPHKLVDEALTRYHVPEHVKEVILDYYNNFSLRFTSGPITSDWHQLQKGIITGCTISVILFALAMNLLVKTAETECRGPQSKTGTRQPPIRAFMDDLTVTTASVQGGRWLLKGLDVVMTWARMRFKPAKSRSLVLKKGKVNDGFRFSVDNTAIPSISEKPVKSLGKTFNSGLRNTKSVDDTTQELEAWLCSVDKSGLPGKFKSWIYQHGVLPRTLWPLLVYDVPTTIVESLERKVSKYLRRWLGLPRSLSSIALYADKLKLRLPFSSLNEEFKLSRTREVMQYRDSSDAKVAQAGIEVRTGRKWSAQQAVDMAESRLQHSVLVGTVASGRSGFGNVPTTRFDKSHGKERRQLVQSEVRAGVEEERITKMVGMRQQGAWVNWEHALERKVTWSEMWRMQPFHFKFLVQSVYDVLPSPSNLCRSGKIDTPACTLCRKTGTLEHVLSCCKQALAGGRYRWRHDQVLKSIANVLTEAIAHSKKGEPTVTSITFVKAGDTGARSPDLLQVFSTLHGTGN